MTKVDNVANVSRRTVLHKAVCVAAAAPAVVAALTANPAMAAGKMSQSAAKYQDTPKDGKQCDGCALFQAPDACKTVSGTIKPEGWCKLYVPKPK